MTGRKNASGRPTVLRAMKPRSTRAKAKANITGSVTSTATHAQGETRTPRTTMAVPMAVAVE